MGAYIDSNKSRYPVAANAVISARDTVYINPTGYATAAPAPSAGIVGSVMGSSIEDVNNTGGADGDRFVIVEHSLGERSFLFPGGALTIADVGKDVYIGATPKTITTTATNAVKAGRLQGIEEADGRARVILPF
ncbi:MAG: hypothetical protein JWP97_5760 [Labilithrix sp.]|nr:hypothetical protein [Labilithrix sp.]